MNGTALQGRSGHGMADKRRPEIRDQSQFTESGTLNSAVSLFEAERRGTKLENMEGGKNDAKYREEKG